MGLFKDTILPALPLVGTVANAISQGATNRASRKFAEKMYNRQRADTIADWERTNSYNSPAAQMARYRDAGLSPHLIYGNANTSTTLDASDKATWNPQAPQVDPGSLMSHYDISLKEAQTDNVRANSDVLLQDVKNKELQAINMVLQNKKLLQDTEQGRELFATSLEAMKESIKQTIANREGKQLENRMLSETFDIRKLQTSLTIPDALLKLQAGLIANAKGAQEITQIKTAIANMRKDSAIKQLEIDWRKGKNNVRHPSDPGTVKVYDTIVQKAGQYLEKAKQAIKNPAAESYMPKRSVIQKWYDIWNK